MVIVKPQLCRRFAIYDWASLKEYRGVEFSHSHRAEHRRRLIGCGYRSRWAQHIESWVLVFPAHPLTMASTGMSPLANSSGVLCINPLNLSGGFQNDRSNSQAVLLERVALGTAMTRLARTNKAGRAPLFIVRSCRAHYGA
jgi:hypothetical protein